MRLHYHPEYLARRSAWQAYRDATHPVDYIFPRAGIGVESYEDASIVSLAEWNQAVNAAILAEASTAALRGGARACRLMRHKAETDASYRNRQQLAVHYMVGDTLCDAAARHVCSAEEERSAYRMGSPAFAAHDRDATGDGMTRSALERELAYWSYIFGACHVLVWRSQAVADLPDGRSSLAAASAAGTYLSLVTPLDLVHWVVGDTGELESVTIRERYRAPSAFGAVVPDAEPRYRTITAQAVTVHRIRAGGETEGADLELVAEYPGAGFVPFVTLYCRDSSTCPDPVGDGFMRSLEPIDRAILNAASWRDDWATNACFPLRAAPNEVLRAAGPKLGNAVIIGINPGDPPLQQLETDRAPYDCLSELIRERIAQAKAIVGVGRGISEESIASRSGDALLHERANERALFRDLLGQLERASNAIDRAWIRMATGSVPPELGETRYDRAFDAEMFEADIDGRFGALLGMGLPPAAQVAIRGFASKQAIRRYGDRATQGESVESIRRWEHDELTAGSAPAPEKPQPVVLGAEAEAALTDANFARIQRGQQPREDWEGKTVATIMAEAASTIALVAQATAGTGPEKPEAPADLEDPEGDSAESAGE